MEKVFKTSGQIAFHQADPAGWLFFGNIFSLAHAAYEEFVRHMGFDYRTWFQNPKFAVPIRSTQATYRAPMAVGTTYEVELSIVDLRTSSFQIGYKFYVGGELCAEVTTLQVFMDLMTKSKTPIPSVFTETLNRFKVSKTVDPAHE